MVKYKYKRKTLRRDDFMTARNKYPFIFVHGMLGWGEAIGINKKAPYWGATTGNLIDFLRKCNYECYSASVGPVSSAWDNACELYAQLTGTRVDYGEAHSKAHGHNRYGRTYHKSLCEGFGQRKFHLIGHSHGGQVIRLLTHLLTNGSEDEINATDPADISPLFKGGKEDCVMSVTTICTPNNGSTLYNITEKYELIHTLGRFTDMVMGLVGRTPVHGKYVDYQLEQFGLTPVRGEFKSDRLITAMNRVRDGEDFVLNDLSLKGAHELNELIEINKNVYYFSYAANGCTGENHKPTNIRFPFLKYFSSLIINLGLPEDEQGISFDESWLDNDGLVNVPSAKRPFDEPAKDFDGELVPGIWNVMPTLICDHGAATGLLADKKHIQGFYINLLRMLMKLE